MLRTFIIAALLAWAAYFNADEAVQFLASLANELAPYIAPIVYALHGGVA